MIKHTTLFALTAAVLAGCADVTQPDGWDPAFAPPRFAVAGQPEVTITITDLGTLGSSSGAFGINDLGQVVGGRSTFLPDGSVETHAFLWTAEGGMVDLGGSAEVAHDINNLGQVVGDGIGSSGPRAFLWTADDGMQDLGTLGGTFSVARGINDLGQVVGVSSTALGAQLAFVWTAEDGMRDLGTLGGTFSSAIDINNLGHVVGGSATASGAQHPFLWTADGGMVDLGLPDLDAGGAQAINDLGQVVGNMSLLAAPNDTRAFLWSSENGVVDLGTLGGDASAHGINNLGQVVGNSRGPFPLERAFLWTETTGMLDLGTLGGSFGFAFDINDLGQIVGSSSLTDDSESHATLWTVSFETILQVSIDIKPGSDPNSINRRSRGNVPVALLGSTTFDVTTVNRETVHFAGAAALRRGGGSEDVNDDGFRDVVFHFATQSLDLPDGTTEACLTGATTDGREFEGCDAVRLVR